MPRPQFRALRFVLAVMLLAVTALAAGPARAATPVDTSKIEMKAVRLTATLPIVPGENFILELRRWTGTGPLNMLAEVVNGTPNSLGTPNFAPDGFVNGEPAERTAVLITAPAAGHHDYQAIFDADARYDAVTIDFGVDVDPVEVTVTVTADVNPVQVNHVVTLQAHGTFEFTGTSVNGSWQWRDTDTDELLTDGDPHDTQLMLTPTSVGIRHIRAEFTGDETHAAANSPVYTVTVTDDRVEASGVTIDVSNFYPYKDGYRDVVNLKGTRLEPASVAVSIYNSSNRRVRTMALAQAAGAYNLPWNGRSNGGTLQPAGKYRIVQVLTDGGGMKLSVTKYVNLSNKRIYYATKYVTKNGSSLSAYGHEGNASTTITKATGIARMRVSSGWTGVGYQFTLPSAAAYKSISFQAYTKAGLSVPQNYIGIQNFKTCAPSYGWHEECFERWRAIGSSSGGLVWRATSGSVTTNRTGSTARGLISVYSGTVYVYKVRIKVVIGVLK